MKKIIVGLLLGFVALLTGCNSADTVNKISFAISADYPPFEYKKNGK